MSSDDEGLVVTGVALAVLDHTDCHRNHADRDEKQKTQERAHPVALEDTIPGAKRVIEVPDARLFFAEDRPDALAGPDVLG